MAEDIEQLGAMLELMLGSHYVSLLNVVDDDMVRRPVFSAQEIKRYENGNIDFKVTINWRLLNKLRKKNEKRKVESRNEL